jgi:hypothetical protein
MGDEGRCRCFVVGWGRREREREREGPNVDKLKHP